MRTDTPTYNSVAVTLHWLIAGLVVIMFFFGLYAASQADALREGHAQLSTVKFIFNWHKTIGLLVLTLAVLRLGWRLLHKAPPLPDDMGTLELLLTRFVHVAFYVLIIGTPLIGWLMISAAESPSFFFNMSDLPIPEIWSNSRDLHETTEELHEYAAWSIMILLALHVAGAFKHHLINRDGYMARMMPWMKRQG